MGKISSYTSVTTQSTDDLLICDQDVSGTLTTMKTTVGKVGTAVAEVQNHASLPTTDKTLVGSITELDSAKPDTVTMTQAQWDAIVDKASWRNAHKNTLLILTDAPNLNATANDLSMGSAPYASGTVGKAITEATGTTASQTITYDSVNFKFRRTQYYVEISLSHGSSKTFPTTWTSIGTLQADLRPTTTNFVFVGFPNGYNMMFRINKDTGNVDIMANSADSMYAQGTGMFMI